MSVEFGLARGGEEQVEDWQECSRTECHRRPQQVVMQWSQRLDKTEPNRVSYTCASIRPLSDEVALYCCILGRCSAVLMCPGVKRV